MMDNVCRKVESKFCFIVIFSKNCVPVNLRPALLHLLPVIFQLRTSDCG